MSHVRFRPLVPFRRVGDLMGNHRVQVDNGAFGLAPRAKCQNGESPAWQTSISLRLYIILSEITGNLSLLEYMIYFIIFSGELAQIEEQGRHPRKWLKTDRSLAGWWSPQMFPGAGRLSVGFWLAAQTQWVWGLGAFPLKLI